MRIQQQSETGFSESDGPDIAPTDPLERLRPLQPTGLGVHDLPVGRDVRSHQQARMDDSREKVILALYDEYRPRLYRYMRSMQLGREHAEEVVQETFMRLTLEFMKEGGLDNVQGWIVRVAHNLAVNVLKKEHGPVVNMESHASIIEKHADPASNPEEVYSKEERSQLMNSALERLKPQYRQCFQMRAQGFRYKDIGLALGISEQRAAFLVKQVAVRLAAVCG